MIKHSRQNSPLAIAALGIYLGLVLVAGVSQVSAQTDEAVQDGNGVFINTRPLKDAAEETRNQIAAKNVDLDKPFSTVVTATIGPGSNEKLIILKDPRRGATTMPGDAAMVGLAERWILALGDAGWFGYLHAVGLKQVSIAASQDAATFSLVIRGARKTPDEAKLVASAFSAMLSLAMTQNLSDGDRAVLKGMKISAQGTAVELKLMLPRAAAKAYFLKQIEPTPTAGPADLESGL